MLEYEIPLSGSPTQLNESKIYESFSTERSQRRFEVRKAFSTVLMLCNVTGEDIRIKSEKKDHSKV